MPSTGLTIIFAGLIGGILWNLLTWLFGIPSSSSHALFGGLIGAGLAALGMAGVNWSGVTQKVLIPAVAAPGHRLPRSPRAAPGWSTGSPATSPRSSVARASAGARSPPPRWSRCRTAPMTHRRPMGVIALALITTGHLTGDVEEGRPAVLDHLQLRAGHRPRHLHRWLAGHPHPRARAWSRSSHRRASPPKRPRPQSFWSSSAAGMALSTTHVATGSILGSGVGKPGAEVRWAVARPDGRSPGWSRCPPRHSLARSRSGSPTASNRSTGSALRRRRPDLPHPRRAVLLHVAARPAAEGRPAATSTPTGTRLDQLGGSRRGARGHLGQQAHRFGLIRH